MAGRFRTAFRATFRTLHLLMLEVFGALFLALAVLFGAETVRQYQLYADSGGSDGLFWVIMALLFTLMMLGFGIHNFWKARGVRK